MNPLSKIFYKKTLSGDEKFGICALIVIIIFDFILFPMPILATEADIDMAELTSSTTKEYLVSQETVDNHSFFLLAKNNNDDTNKLITKSIEIPEKNIDEPTNINKTEKMEINDNIANHLPKNTGRKIISTDMNMITAYNSEVVQCDSDPCTTANGFNVCKHGIEDTVAANHLAFGTKLKIPALFGDRIFIVRDRMNSRYADYIDVWMINKKDAIQFGTRMAKVEIIE